MVNQLHRKIYGAENYGVNERYVCLEGCYMYISPGEHNKLAMEEPIPVGTILECEYYYNYWTYTTYNGVSGWIIDLDWQTGYGLSKVARVEDYNLITTTSTLLYDKPVKEAKAIDSIPKNTEFSSRYSYDYGKDVFDGYFCVSYNHQLGWISIDDCAIEREPYSQNLEFAKDLVIDGKTLIQRGKIVNLNSKYARFTSASLYDVCEDYYFSYNGYNFWYTDLIGVYELDEHYVILYDEYDGLPTNQKLKLKVPIVVDYFEKFEEWSIESEEYIVYNGELYSLPAAGVVYTIDENYYDIHRATQNFDLIISPLDETVVTTVHSGDIIYSPSSDQLYCITLDGEEGLYREDTLYFDDVSTHIATYISKVNIQDYLTKLTNGEIDLEEQTKQSGEVFFSGEATGEEVINIFDIQNQKKEQSNINMAILCICGAVVLALTSIVIIILANKKLVEVNKKNIISEEDVDWKETNTQEAEKKDE